MSVIKHVTLQKIVAHDFRCGPRSLLGNELNCLDCLSRLRQQKGLKNFSQFKCVCKQSDTVSRALCCSRTTVSAVLMSRILVPLET